MCRILAICSDHPESDRELSRQVLFDFRALAATGIVAGGLPPGHQDGWGVVAYRDGAPVFYSRVLGAADTDERFLSAVKLAEDLSPDTVIAHLRKASQGSLSTENAQPFLDGNLAFCHNGSLSVSVREAEAEHQSDSAAIFHRSLAAGDGVASLEKEIERGQTGDYTAAITVIADGQNVVARRLWNEAHPEAHSRGFDGYFTLYLFERPGLRVVCSERLPSLANLSCRLLENGERIVLR